MTLQAISELAGIPIIDLNSGDILGVVSGWVVGPADQKVWAYVLQKNGWRSSARVLLSTDVVEYGPRMLIVTGPNSLAEASDILGVPEAIRTKSNLIGYSACDKDGRAVGRVKDFLFDITDASIQRYCVTPSKIAGIFYHDLLLTRSQFVSLHDKTIVFDLDARIDAPNLASEVTPRSA